MKKSYADAARELEKAQEELNIAWKKAKQDYLMSLSKSLKLNKLLDWIVSKLEAFERIKEKVLMSKFKSKNMTYQNIYDLFIQKNQKLKKQIDDWRIAGYMSIYVWFKTGTYIVAYYNIKTAEFEITEIGTNNICPYLADR